MADVFVDRPGADLWYAQEMKGKAGMREYIESIELWCPSKAPGVRKVRLLLGVALSDGFYLKSASEVSVTPQNTRKTRISE